MDGGTTYYVIKDHLSSTRVVMNGSSGTGVEFHAYDAWGKIMQSVVSPNVRYKFTGQEYETETDINNFRARMYDQSLGRFYAADPAGQNFAPYGYAVNNPMSFVDPSGQVSEEFLRRQAEFNNDNRKFLGINAPVWFDNNPFWNTIGASDVWASWYRSSGDNWAADGSYHSLASIMDHRSSADLKVLEAQSIVLNIETAKLRNQQPQTIEGPSQVVSDEDVARLRSLLSTTSGLTNEQIANIVFNEIRSLHNPDDVARLSAAAVAIAHVILNGEAAAGTVRLSHS